MEVLLDSYDWQIIADALAYYAACHPGRRQQIEDILDAIGEDGRDAACLGVEPDDLR
jgi:hypothetical protein